jgi:predicted nucleic acid-binding protein
MSDRIFLDTNVLVYAFDDSDLKKQKRAWEILEHSSLAGQAILSTQVLQEFYVTVRRLERPLEEAQAEEAVRRLAKLPVVQIDGPMVLSAIGISRSYHLSLWDSLIIRAAIEGDCRRLLSEDLHHGQRIESLQLENPFLDDPSTDIASAT